MVESCMKVNVNANLWYVRIKTNKQQANDSKNQTNGNLLMLKQTMERENDKHRQRDFRAFPFFSSVEFTIMKMTVKFELSTERIKL